MKDIVKLTGFAELERSLGEFKKSTERSVLRRVAVKALEPIRDEAQRLVPVDTGQLRDSIVIGTKLNRNAKRAAKKDPVEGVRVFLGTADRNAVPIEFGTVEKPLRAFLRPAWDRGKGDILNDLAGQLRTEINRTAARLVKKGKPNGR